MNTTSFKRLNGNGKNNARFEFISRNTSNGDNHNNSKDFSADNETINTGIEYQLNNLKITKKKNKKIIERVTTNTNNASSCGDNGNLGKDDEEKEKALINERIIHDSSSLTHERVIELNNN